MATPTLYHMSSTFLSIILMLTRSSAQDYALNVSVESTTSHSAIVEWTATNITEAARYAITVVHDRTGTLLVNKTISLDTTIFAITGLEFSRIYTVELRVLDSAGKTVIVDSVAVSTDFVWNDKFIVALCVIGFIAVVSILLLILQAICLSEDKRARSYKNREV